MATLAQITAKDTATLTALERNHARRVLGVEPITGTAFAALEAVFDALPAERNQEARAILDDWDDIPAEPVHKSGGAKGIDYKTADHRYQVYADMSRVLGQPVATYTVWIAAVEESAFQVVNITLGGLYGTSGSEF